MPASEPVPRRHTLSDARAGDLSAFEEVVRVYTPAVLRLAQRLLLHGADAEDAVQETFLKLWNTFGKYDLERNFLTWLYRITVNVCHDLRRKKKTFLGIEHITDEPHAEDRDPEQSAHDRERRELLFAALESLNPREREALVLRDLEGLTSAEVAYAMGTSETTVRSQISTARVKLRERLREQLREGL